MKIEHIAMYVNDLERAKDFFAHYFHAAAGENQIEITIQRREYYDNEVRRKLVGKLHINNQSWEFIKMLHIRKAKETDRNHVALCIAEAFEKDFSILCKDNQKVADAIAAGLNMENFMWQI